MRVRVTMPTIVGGRVVQPDDVVDVSNAEGRDLIRRGRAKEVRRGRPPKGGEADATAAAGAQADATSAQAASDKGAGDDK